MRRETAESLRLARKDFALLKLPNSYMNEPLYTIEPLIGLSKRKEIMKWLAIIIRNVWKDAKA